MKGLLIMSKQRRNYKPRRNQGGNKPNERQADKSNPKGSGNATADMENVTSNNIEWWSKSPIYSDVNRIPVNVIQGYCYDTNDIIPDSKYFAALGLSTDMPQASAMPGIMTLEYIPFSGPCANWNDAINRSWLSIFSAYAAKTSGTFQIQQPDLALVGEAANSIIVNIYEIKRLLGLANLYSNVNQYMPKALIEAAGFKPEYVIGHQDDIRRRLNYLISAFNTLNLPGYTDIHLRRAQLAHNVYADEDDVRAQLYVFKSKGYYIYRDTKDGISDAEHLEWIQYSGFDNFVELRLDTIESQINALRDSASFGLVSAAVLRAFGDRQLLRIDLEPIDSITVPVFDRNMNWQINNADIVSNINPHTLHITCDIHGNALVCQPSVLPGTQLSNSEPALFVHQKYLNSYDGVMSEEFMMEATRFKVGSNAYNDPQFDPTKYATPLNICGTEIITGMYIFNMEVVNEGDSPTLNRSTKLSSWMKYSGDYTQSIASLMHDLTKFRNHPLINLLIVEPVTKTAQVYTVGDLYRYTRLETSALAGLHEAALQSIYTLNPAIEVGNKA